MRPLTSAVLVTVLVAHAAFACAGAPQGGAAVAEKVDSSVAPSDTVAQQDAIDVLRQWLHRPVQTEVKGTIPFGLDWSLLPTVSYNPVYGVAVGAMLSGAGRLGSKTMRFSQLAVSANYSSEGQFQAQVRGDVYGGNGNGLMKADFRYLDTTRSTWGLGPMEPDQEEYPMEFNLTRAYATFFRRVSGPVFIGLGYHFDEFQDIVDTRAAAGDSTPFTDYSGGAPGHTIASGMSINVLADTRDNLVNPSAGYYLSWSFRNYLKDLGADQNWQELWVEMRVYPHVPKRSQNVLAFWLYGWMTFGPGPYLNLPSDGWDTYGRGARGYLQGRIRGASQLYFESEYRFSLTPSGLLGGVVFYNITTTTQPEEQSFGRPDGALGVGLRLKFNKHTDTNLTIDHGWGREGSRGFFLGMSEVF